MNTLGWELDSNGTGTVKVQGVETSLGSLGVDFSSKSPTLDAFGRLRTSSVTTLFDAQNHYGNLHQNFTQILTSGGTVTDSPVDSSLTLAVTATVGSKVINRSRRHFYVAGQSHLVAMTCNFKAPISGIRKRVGYYDNDDGVFFEQGSDGIMYLVKRTSTSGVAVDNRVPQTSWNLDKLDGTGPSGIIVDWTKTQILMFDMQWLGVGRVRYYVDIDGKAIIVHQLLNANSLTQVYMQTPHLPCSYEIENISSGAGSNFMQICAAVFTEGQTPVPQVRRCSSNDVTAITAGNGVLTHLISIRPAALFKGRSNKGMCVPIEIEVFNNGAANGNSIHFHILEDCVLTTPTWVAQGSTDSMMEYCVAAGGITTVGRSRDEGYVLSGGKGGSSNSIIDQTYNMQINPSGTSDVLTIAIEGIGGTATAMAKISWNEIY